MIGAFVAGGLLALAALAFVLVPVVRGDAVMRMRGGAAPDEAEDAIGALREVEFDRATGKLSDDDYASLSARRCAAAGRATWCSSCGRYLPEACPRCRSAVTEDGASYCSHCGVNLARA
ncbi:MAG: hypothetical protein HY275_16950 [Gemmatimonadetes bacterium]|nr:hypothetical protein [Gemmatimonadota bacterium]